MPSLSEEMKNFDALDEYLSMHPYTIYGIPLLSSFWIDMVSENLFNRILKMLTLDDAKKLKMKLEHIYVQSDADPISCGDRYDCLYPMTKSDWMKQQEKDLGSDWHGVEI